MVSKERVAELVKKFGKNEKDTGSAEVQVAILSDEINNLTAHLKTHIHDLHTKRGLMIKIGKRKSLLTYIKNRDLESYKNVVSALGLRK